MLYLALATTFFGLALIFIKLTIPKIYPLLGNLLFLAFAAIIQLGALLYARSKGAKIFFTKEGFGLSALGGIFLGLYTIFLFLTFSRMDISKASPVIYVGAVSLATVFGTFFLGESFSWINLLGLLLAFGGLFLLFVK